MVVPLPTEVDHRSRDHRVRCGRTASHGQWRLPAVQHRAWAATWAYGVTGLRLEPTDWHARSAFAGRKHELHSGQRRPLNSFVARPGQTMWHSYWWDNMPLGNDAWVATMLPPSIATLGATAYVVGNGMNSTPRVRTTASRDSAEHPRSRGEDQRVVLVAAADRGTPPLARGRPNGHPFSIQLRNGTPPLARGRLHLPDHVGDRARNTPARAGKTATTPPASNGTREHPRSRGEDAR